MSGPVWKVAYLTGAGSGIGLRLAEMLAQRNVRVAVFDLKISDEVRQRLSRTAPGSVFHEVDVRDAAGLEAAVRAAVAGIGAPQLAINCAGVQRARVFEELTAADFDFVVGINLYGSRNFAAAVLPHLPTGGRLVFIASLAGLVGNYGYAAYNASKFGVVGLASALRIECKPRGIGVTVVCPPEVETPMVVEERKTAPAITMQSKQFAGVVTLDELCEDILAGAARGEWMVVTGFKARFTRLVARLAPGVLNRLTDRMVADGLRKAHP
jgi:NAD(P)-dependent dehydrogenase (short-subunit alcohol dehydrogenase family)